MNSIDNWFSSELNRGKTWADFERVRKSFPNSRDSRTSPLRYDDRFVNLCRSIGYSSKY